MNLTEIGAALREAREGKGLSIDAVEKQIKISRSILMALEEGDIDKFPHPVYARGFVRSYAALLDLDEQDLTAHFSREYPLPPDNDHSHDHSGPQITVRYNDSARQSLARWFVIILGLVALGLLGWYAYNTSWSPFKPALEEAESQPEVEPSAVLPPVQVAPLTQMQEISEDAADISMITDQATESELEDSNASTDTDPVPDTQAELAVDNNADNAEEQAAVTATTKTPEEKVQDQEGAPGLEAAPSTQLQAESVPQEVEQTSTTEPVIEGQRVLVISAHAASWLQARADDKVTDYFLRKGESTKVSFVSTLTLKLGNAGGVNLTLDGQPYPLEAKSGEVRTLVFN